MLKSDFLTYFDEASDNRDIGVAVYSIETGKMVALSYNIVTNISEHNELIISIAIDTHILE